MKKLSSYLKAWGWWLGGVVTVLLALWLASRQLYTTPPPTQED